MKERYLITARKGFGLGDIVLLTALTRDLHATYPGRFDLEVNTNFRPVWYNNPHAKQVDSDPLIAKNRTVVIVNYTAGIRRSQQGEKRHFINAFYDDFTKQTGVVVHPRKPHGDLHLIGEETERKIQWPYWVVLAGGKNDMTVKHWDHAKYQKVVDYLVVKGIRCVQAGSSERRHWHRPLDNAMRLVGQTPDLRQFFSLIYHAEGVICGITSAMHIAACFSKPAVIVAGGREEPWFSGYTNAYKGLYGPVCEPIRVEHKFLHTLGLLECCQTRGCWKKRTVPLDPGDYTANGRRFVCVDRIGDQPHCLNLIEPEHVVEAVESYYRDSTLQLQKTWPSTSLPVIRDENVPTSEVLFSPATTERLQVTEHEAHELRKPCIALKPVKHPLYDNPIIGGKFTVFVLCYGDHTPLARQCIDSIVNNVPIDRIDLRVACNAVSQSTLDYLRQQPISVVYDYKTNRFKYPVMRDVFRDPHKPIDTNYLLWFDDDSRIADIKWLERLSQTIIDNHPHGGRLYGRKFYHDTRIFMKGGHEPRKWFWDSGLYPRREFRLRRMDRSAPNGTCIDFVPGSFWAIHTPLIHELNIPDPRLVHNGGDIAIGAAVQLSGKNYKLVGFDQNQSMVLCSKAPRRGYAESMPWANEQKKEHLPS